MFRKKQTPVGRQVQRPNQPSAVFSYYSSRSGADASRARYEPPADRRPGLQRFKHIPSVIALVVIAGTLFYASLLDAKPRVIIAASSSGKSLQRPTKVYEDFIIKEFQKSFTNKSKFTFNADPVIKNLQRTYPEVANAIVTIPIVGHRPVVHIAVSSPAFVLATSTGAYYVSDGGKPLVRVAEVANPLPNMITVTDETGLPIKVGEQVLPQDTVLFITEVIQQLKATNTPVDSVVLPLEANELRLRISGQPYYVRLNTTNDARVQVGTFLAIKNRLEGSGEIPKEYIDVRVEERAYYK